ncbi:hypothetical protein [Pseudactinotalea suaedae]|uniref:hypothetical protein n=1 Tax=Pseudactinotalea suaedae TaxID=1524924 RepID=UPI0012E16B9A|nr:hypothetical protein [Pseudactinotalea suaedae]
MITSSGAQPTLVGRNTGSGAAASFQSTTSNGFAGGTKAPDRYGLSASNTATAPGNGAAVAASGNRNAGVIVNTANADKYAIRAANLSTQLGSAGAVLADGGTGVGLVASTDADDVPAIASSGALVALGPVIVADPSGLISFVAGVVPVFGASSAGSPTVQFSGNATLTAGGASFALDPDTADALDLSAASVVVTPNSGPMPNLWATVSESGQLTITGGTADGVVSYLVTAPTLMEVAARRAAPDYPALVDRAREARSV